MCSMLFAKEQATTTPYRVQRVLSSRHTSDGFQIRLVEAIKAQDLFLSLFFPIYRENTEEGLKSHLVVFNYHRVLFLCSRVSFPFPFPFLFPFQIRRGLRNVRRI